jgi:NTE family protein
MIALVLSGGGEKGAYQVGALQLLTEIGFDPDIITGISVGAMNGGFLSQFPETRFGQGVLALSKMWLATKTEHVVKHWIPPYVTIPWKGCVYDSSPQREMVDSWVVPQDVANSGRLFAAVAVDWKTGEIVVGREDDPDIRSYIKASSSFPLMMEPVMVGDRLCTDGGLRDVAPIKQALKMGATEVVIIACSNPDLPSNWEPPKGITRFISFAKRAIDIMSTEVVTNDYRVCGLKNELAETKDKYKPLKTTIIRPLKPLGTNVLEFSKEQSERLMVRGYEDARAATLGFNFL